MNDDLKITWNIFYRYSTNGSNKMDVTIAISTKYIIRMLQRREPLVCNDM